MRSRPLPHLLLLSCFAAALLVACNSGIGDPTASEQPTTTPAAPQPVNPSPTEPAPTEPAEPTPDPTVIEDPDDAPPETALSFATERFTHRGGERCETDEEICTSVEMVYPVVESAPNPRFAEEFDRVVAAFIGAGSFASEPAPPTLQELADSFTTSADAAPTTPNGWALDRGLRVVFCSDELVTLEATEYSYTGGAHGNYSSVYTVLRIDDGEQVGLEDLLAAGYEATLTAEGEKAFRAVRELSQSADLAEEGFWFTDNQFHLNENFGVLDDGIGFVFNTYEVAPYVMSSTAFTVPTASIESLARPSGPLADAANGGCLKAAEDTADATTTP